MQSVKILITGPVRAGTTTLIRSLSEIAVLTTQRRVPGVSRNPGDEKTVAMDFGRVRIDDDVMLYLFGTPGDEQESLIGGALADGMIGLIVMVDATRPVSVDEAAEIVAFLERSSSAPYVVAANRLGECDEAGIARLRRGLDVPDDVPVIACDATKRSSVKAVVAALLRRILQTMP